jgi:8-oxo-dGTP pyrophosphatase MutT (NUDIX family)
MPDDQFVTDGKPLIHAATVLLLRDGPTGLEVFMVVRHHQIDSFSGALVFPGGKVDETDLSVRPHCRGENTMTDLQVETRVGAVREAFEECGVLLAMDEGEDKLVSPERLKSLEPEYRLPIRDGEKLIATMCDDQNLTLAIDRLVPFAHWVTTPMAPKIFNTYFYLAEAPNDQLALHDGEESTDSEWIRPADAIAAAEDGNRTLVFPTRMNLWKLSQSNSVAEALENARRDRFVMVQPKAGKHPEGRILSIPEAAGYGGSDFLVKDGGLFIRPLD